MSFAERIVCPQDLQICCDTRPLFGKHFPISSFRFNLRGGDGGTEGPGGRKKITGLVTEIKRVDIGRRVRRLPAVESAYIQWGRRYRWRFWRLRLLRAVIVFIAILCLVYHRHRCQDVEWIG